MALQIDIPTAAFRTFCARWNISELAFFGSVLRPDFGPDSDVDVLVSFHPNARPTLLDMARMRSDLEKMFGRNVDLVTRRAVERSRNPFRKGAILSSAEVVYGRDWAYLADMLDAARLAVSYTIPHDRASFLKDVQCQDSVIRRLEIVGEAARRVSAPTRSAHPNILGAISSA